MIRETIGDNQRGVNSLPFRTGKRLFVAGVTQFSTPKYIKNKSRVKNSEGTMVKLTAEMKEAFWKMKVFPVARFKFSSYMVTGNFGADIKVI